MKIISDAQAFIAAFNSVSPAVPSRTPKDVLLNVLVIPKDGGLLFVATDMQDTVSHFMEDVKIEGDAKQFLLPHKRVQQVLRGWSSDEIQIELDGEKVLMKGTGAKFNILTSPPEDFPPSPEFVPDGFWTVPAPVFVQAIRKTVFAADEDWKSFNLGGVNVLFEDNRVIKLCSTDTKQLALFTAACETTGSPEFPSKTVIMPPKALALLQRNISPSDEDVDMVFRDGSVVFRCGDTIVSGRLLEGRFPKYERIIPDGSHNEFEIPAGILLRALGQATVFTDVETACVQFDFADDKITMRSRSASVGESEISVPIPWGHGPITVGFDPSYLLQMLKVLAREDLVEVNVKSEEEHVVFRVGDSYTYLVAPIAVS